MAGSVIGAVAGGAGAAIGTRLVGGSDEDARDNAVGGVITSGLSGGPAGYGIFKVGKHCTK